MVVMMVMTVMMVVMGMGMGMGWEWLLAGGTVVTKMIYVLSATVASDYLIIKIKSNLILDKMVSIFIR